MHPDSQAPRRPWVGVEVDETGGEGGYGFPRVRQEHCAARLGHHSAWYLGLRLGHREQVVAMKDLGFGKTAEGREEP